MKNDCTRGRKEQTEGLKGVFKEWVGGGMGGWVGLRNGWMGGFH